MGKLEEIFELQKKFGQKFTNFGGLDEQEKKIKTLEFIDHCIEELIEMRREIPFRKHWSSKRDNPVDKARLLDEYVDVLHFYVSLALINEWTAEDIYNAYLDKNKVNHDRQKNNY